MTYINTKPLTQPLDYIDPFAGMAVQSLYKAPAPDTSLADAFTPKRAGKAKSSHVIFLLDGSYSMQSCKQATISGFNEFLASQVADVETSKIETFASCYVFTGSGVDSLFTHTPVDKVKKLTELSYDPRGYSTNLYDGFGAALMQINKELSEKKKKHRESVILVVLTDGQENSSKVFNAETIKAMVKKAEAKNWGFMFLGANIDAFAVGSTLGLGHHNTMTYSTNKMDETMIVSSRMVNSLKSAVADGVSTTAAYSSVGFTDDERSSVKGD